MPRRRRAWPQAPIKHPNYTAVFAAELIELARTDRRIVGITAGMPTGTGMAKFQAEFPDRMFDVGIAEQHAMTMATGLAMGGMRPVVALYSTFLQRAFDQTVHDVCQNDQPVLIAVDRAGLVGEDGTSHQGMFTLPAQRQLPNLVIASPKDEQELRSLLHSGARPGPPVRAALPARCRASVSRRSRRRSSRSAGARSCARATTSCSWASGRSSCARSRPPTRSRPRAGRSASSTPASREPLDRQLILDQARGKRMVVTFEESVVTGGFGSGVLELIEEARLADPAYRETSVRILGIPGERFVDHGSVADLRRVLRLDAPGLAGQVREALETLRATPGRSEVAAG